MAIKDVAERTGLGIGTVRMWEQRYGFPSPRRTASGYRRYTAGDVEVLRRAVALKETGLAIPAALERARDSVGGETDRPSIYGAVLAAERMPIRPRKLRKRTLIAMSGSRLLRRLPGGALLPPGRVPLPPAGRALGRGLRVRRLRRGA
jgi:DNA-binding transcriptional MerR regulator